jgi:hypothetical protein
VGASDVNGPRVLLGIWLVLTIGWLRIAGYDLYMRWPEYYVFYKRPDGLLIGAMVRKDLTESLGFALVPPIALLLIGSVVLWSVRGLGGNHLRHDCPVHPGTAPLQWSAPRTHQTDYHETVTVPLLGKTFGGGEVWRGPSFRPSARSWLCCLTSSTSRYFYDG